MSSLGAFPCRQITDSPHGHILTNTAVWSPDGEWLVYDVRTDAAGAVFDGTRIERVHVESGQVEVLYESRNGACCGVATCHPTRGEVVFILGPENPTADWQYSACHRRGVIVDANRPNEARNLDARDLTPPFTPGALRGGSHVHVFSPDGKHVSFTYEDHLLTELMGRERADLNQRNIGVSLIGKLVIVPKTHPRNHDGEAFSVIVTKTVNNPRPGSDEISRAYEDAWIDNRRLAFLGDAVRENGEKVTELFIVELPDDITVEGSEPITGAANRRPSPPAGTKQRRITFTADRKFPGIRGVRHWPRSSPDGSQIAFLMRDDAGTVQLWTVSPNGDSLRQVTNNRLDIASAFSWHPAGKHLAAIVGESVCVIDAETGNCQPIARYEGIALRGEACVFSSEGARVAFVAQVAQAGATYNQIFVAESGL